MQTFHLFSPTHALVVVTFAATVLAVVALGRRWRGTPRAATLDRWLAAVTAAAAALAIGWPLLPHHFGGDWSLPLHMCDLSVLVVPVVLLTGRPWARAIAYFWGLGLSSQGFITPDLQDGPARMGFWVFWASHFAVVGAPIYDVAARGYRPTWRAWAATVAAGLAYVAIMLPLDVLTGWNYGYVGPSTPDRPTIVDVLGPWPLRVVWIVLLSAAATAVLMLPWDLARRLHNPGRGTRLPGE